MTTANHPIPFRIGHGYDLHRLEPLNPSSNRSADAEDSKPLVLGGIGIEHDKGPVGHSDGDAALHALTDAILGALGEPDIGEIFPNNSPKWRDANSAIFLHEANARMRAQKYEIANLDITIILEKPKLQPYKDAIRANLAELLQIPADRVNIKGKTHEKVDAVGQGQAVEVHAVVLLQYCHAS